MNPYDRRRVRTVWARVMPGRDVFAPGPWGPPPPPPPPAEGPKPPAKPPAPSAVQHLSQLAQGYDSLARRYRSPLLRQMAAQCRRGAGELQKRCGQPAPGRLEEEEASASRQQETEAALRRSLEGLPCAPLAQKLSRESRNRSRMLGRMR